MFCMESCSSVFQTLFPCSHLPGKKKNSPNVVICFYLDTIVYAITACRAVLGSRMTRPVSHVERGNAACCLALDLSNVTNNILPTIKIEHLPISLNSQLTKNITNASIGLTKMKMWGNIIPDLPPVSRLIYIALHGTGTIL